MGVPSTWRFHGELNSEPTMNGVSLYIHSMQLLFSNCYITVIKVSYQIYFENWKKKMFLVLLTEEIEVLSLLLFYRHTGENGRLLWSLTSCVTAAVLMRQIIMSIEIYPRSRSANLHTIMTEMCERQLLFIQLEISTQKSMNRREGERKRTGRTIIKSQTNNCFSLRESKVVVVFYKSSVSVFSRIRRKICIP